MSRVLAATIAAVLLAGCAESPGPLATSSPSPTDTSTTPPPSPTPTAAATDLAGASCDDRDVGGSSNIPDFVEVEATSSGGVDRVSFRFRPRDPDASEPPSFNVRFTDELFTDGEGAPVELEGEQLMAVTFTAIGYDLEAGEPVYTGPRNLSPGYPMVKEIEQTGDFEGVVSWGIGLAREACFVLHADEDEITLEFPSA